MIGKSLAIGGLSVIRWRLFHASPIHECAGGHINIINHFVFLPQVYGADSYMQYFPLLLYSIVPLVASTLYTFLAKALNDFEEHTTAVRKKNMLVIKVRLLFRCVFRA